MPSPIGHVILDRDGVLNVERGDGRHVENWAQWFWVPGSLHALQVLHRLGIRVSVVTNQSAVGRGCMAQADLAALHARMVDEVACRGGNIAEVLVCPHAPGAGCGCRKPAPGLVLRALARARIRPGATVMIGDDLRDLDAASAAAVAPILVRTGKGRAAEAVATRRGVPVFDDLSAFVDQVQAAARAVVGEK